jgi:aspartyl/asparaginyl-tRNA synthetase
MDLVHSTITSASVQKSSSSSIYDSKLIIDSKEFTTVVKKLRDFFLSKNFVEAHPQNRLSILAACEDPFTVATFNYAGETWPLPQTGQMWLEYELLNNPTPPGYFCLSTSYREEPNPVEGRHDLIFPLFEFEMKGDMEALINLEKELLEYLGYNRSLYPVRRYKYDDAATSYSTTELTHDHETQMYDNGKQAIVILTDFPESTDPFWNMKRNKNWTAKKVDIILSGQETFGSAERETDTNVMWDRFHSICNGAYKEKLISLFGEERTMKEIEDYLKLNFFPRSGGGIGMTRLIRSMKMENLL